MSEQTVWRLEGAETREPFHYTECGLDNVYLASGYEKSTSPDGEEGVRVHNVEGLLEAIGIFLATRKKELVGQELRYLRKHIGMTQKELGGYVRLTSQQVARWEKDQCKAQGSAEAIVRVLFLEHVLGTTLVTELLRDLDSADDNGPDVALFEETDDGWQAKAA
ncbi:MAG: helix-turn-helix domain-containing protein [Pseudomonadota bacterium]